MPGSRSSTCREGTKSAAGAIANHRIGKSAHCAIVAIATMLSVVVSQSDAQQVNPEPQSDAELHAASSDDPLHGMDPDELRRAGPRWQKILDEAREIDKAQGVYPEDFVLGDVLDFYRFGIGTKDEPANTVVTRKFCREVVLGLLWDVFFVIPPEEREEELGSDDFRNLLDEDGAKLFRRLVSETLQHLQDAQVPADDVLSVVQRSRLYRIAQMTLTSEDVQGVAALQSLSSREEFTDEERQLVEYTLDAIFSRGNQRTSMGESVRLSKLPLVVDSQLP